MPARPHVVALAVCFSSLAIAPALASPATPPGSGDATAAPVPPPRTEQFERGELRLPDAAAAQLESFLQDLNRRKDFDYACHGGQPGPDAAFLADWVRRVDGELQARGYYYDDAGNLHRPGPVVPLR